MLRLRQTDHLIAAAVAAEVVAAVELVDRNYQIHLHRQTWSQNRIGEAQCGKKSRFAR